MSQNCCLSRRHLPAPSLRPRAASGVSCSSLAHCKAESASRQRADQVQALKALESWPFEGKSLRSAWKMSTESARCQRLKTSVVTRALEKVAKALEEGSKMGNPWKSMENGPPGLEMVVKVDLPIMLQVLLAPQVTPKHLLLGLRQPLEVQARVEAEAVAEQMHLIAPSEHHPVLLFFVHIVLFND